MFIEYPIIILFILLGMVLLIYSNDILLLFLSLELQSLPLYLLTSININSSIKYFILGSLSTSILLLGLSLLYGETGITDLESIRNLLVINNLNIKIALILILIGLLFKLAGVPFHNWAINVYSGIPLIILLFIMIIPKISIIGLLISLPNLKIILEIIMISSIGSILIGSILGINQYNIKKIIIYSSISHIGYILLSIALNGNNNNVNILTNFYIIQYILTSILLITCIYLINNNILWLQELITNNNYLIIPIILSSFSLAGIPPLIGFHAKQLIFTLALYNGYYFSVFIGIIGSIISTIYYLNIIKYIAGFNNKKEEKITENKITILVSYIISILTITITMGFIIKPIIINMII